MSMCNQCCENESFVCNSCGALKDEEWGGLSPFYVDRRNLKDLASQGGGDENLVWLLRYKGKIVRVGYGGIGKLYKETKPSPYYIKFDGAFVYWLGDEEWRNRFALCCMAKIDGVQNRKGVESHKYCGKMALRFRSCVPAYVRRHVIEDPDLKVGEFGYYDADKLREDGYVY